MQIFIDDERMPQQVSWCRLPDVQNWTIVRSVGEFRSLVQQQLSRIQWVSFDHDLGHPTESGLKCLRILVEACFDAGRPIPLASFHSMNPVGRHDMLNEYVRATEVLGIAC